ncbi:MAG: tRNA (guanosine(37)-N1)-methyltransferase TrmD [Armatimonadetes bacterium]|nr:tRNA (guanosine(37)-N1)-methyltransferase TrmD [Armatimonadota bacterium]
MCTWSARTCTRPSASTCWRSTFRAGASSCGPRRRCSRSEPPLAAACPVEGEAKTREPVSAPLRISILTVFPEMVGPPLAESILKRARDRGLVEIEVLNIRDFAADRHKSTDDYPYGGGPGMVMRPEPIVAAAEAACAGAGGPPPEDRAAGREVILLTPAGEPFTQATARELSGMSHLILVCGHYEGVDERVRELIVTREVSIGDYVLTGGELPALVVTDAVARLVPGVLGGEESAAEESFSGGLLEYPQYTRPREFRGLKVPDVLLSGHHEQVRRWRRRQSLARTWQRRPELLAQAALTAEDEAILAELRRDESRREGGEDLGE